MYCALSFIYKGSHLPWLNKNLEVYLPPFVWFIFFFYLFFPSKTAFNYKGRLYFFEMCRDILISPFIHLEFLIPWATDQMLSLVIPLKDMAYTVCYTFAAIKTGSTENQCFDSPYSLIEKIIIFSPLMYRFF